MGPGFESQRAHHYSPILTRNHHFQPFLTVPNFVRTSDCYAAKRSHRARRAKSEVRQNSFFWLKLPRIGCQRLHLLDVDFLRLL